MWLRRGFYAWLMPAAIILPIWLVVGWLVFQREPLSFLWMVFIAVPSVLVGQTVFTLLVRARPVARLESATSWLDVAGFGLWHALTIALGFYPDGWFGVLFAMAILVGFGMVPLLLGQLWSEARGSLEALKPERSEVYIVQESTSKPA